MHEFVFLAESAGKVNENYYRNHKFYYQEADPDKKIMLWDKNVVFFPRRINGKSGIPSPDQAGHSNCFCKQLKGTHQGILGKLFS